MANLDGIAQFEYHRMQLVASLTAVAESMRNSANMADTFATIVKQSSFAPNSPALHMIQGMNQMLSDGNAFAPNGSAPTASALQQTSAAADASPSTAPPRASGGKRKAAVLEEGAGSTKAKRIRKPKDPNAPKRPASSYILFQNDIRKELKAMHPNVPNPELLTMIARKWQSMSEEDKAVYNQATASAKERYSADKKAYDARTSVDVTAADEATVALHVKKPPAKARVPKTKEVVPTVPAPPSAPSRPTAPTDTSASTETSEESSEELSEEEDEHDEEDDDDEEEAKPVPKKAKKGFVPPVVPSRKERKKPSKK